jgi:hypothetical protein
MSITRLGIAVIVVVVIGVSLVYAVFDPLERACSKGEICPRYVDLMLTLTLIVTGVATLFGTMAMSGAQNPDGSFREQRIRLSIAMTVLVVYLVYFGMAVLWTQHETPALVGTLTDLLKITIPFYFGASAFAQWSESGSGSQQRPKKKGKP